MKEEDQRLLNDSAQEDGEIEREGGRRMEAREVWEMERGNRYISSGPCCLSAGSLKWPFNCRAKSDIKASRVKEDSHILILPILPLSVFPSLASSFPLCFLLCVPSQRGGAGPSTINLLSNNTGNVTHYWKEMGKMNQ